MACLLLASVACGTTVQTSAGTLAGPAELGSTDGLSLPADGSAPQGLEAGLGTSNAAGLAVDGTAQTELPGAGGAAAADGVASQVAAGGEAVNPGSPLRNGPGVTDKTISIGFPYAPNADEAQAAFGNNSNSQGDPKAVFQALVDETNRAGGIAGRKLVPIYYKQDAQSGETADQRAQSLCEAFTVDSKVLALFGASGPLLRDCLRKNGVVNVSGSIAQLNEADFRKAPNYYDTFALTLDKAARNLVDQLVAQRYFQAWDSAEGKPGGLRPVKVGVLAPDTSWVPVVKEVLLPALKNAGFPVGPDSVRIWKFPKSEADYGAAVAEIQSIVLRFRTENVTHVLPMEGNSLAFFTPTAEGQGYRPRYGLSGATDAQGFAGNLVPYRQLRGSVGVGWLPAVDLPESKQTPAYAGPGRKRCLDVMARAEISFPSNNARAIALLLCDAFSSFDRAAESLRGRPISLATFMPALEALGSSYQAASLPIGGFGPGKRYAVVAGYPWGFSEPCQCFAYTGGRFTLR